MKKIALSLLLHIAALTSACAQAGLSLQPVYDGAVVAKDRMVEAEVRGSQLKKYGLTYFHSIKFTASANERAWVDSTVVSLFPDAEELEQETQQGHLYYAVMTLPPASKGKPKRFVCYQCATLPKQQYAISLIYMEGDAMLAQLRKTFKKK